MKYLIKNSKQLLSGLLFFFLVATGEAQTSRIVTGIVKDVETGLPVENVNITLFKSTTGTVSNVDGIFRVSVARFPAVLQFSHISFYKKSITILKTSTDTIKVLLTQRPVNLNEAEIISGKYRVLKGKNKEIVDYDFIDTNLLVLIKNTYTRKYELIVMNDLYDTIGKVRIRKIKHPKSIFKDCMGNCHLLTNDSAYQLSFDERNPRLIYAVNLDRFKKLLGNCLFETPKYLVFTYNSNNKPDLMYATRNPIEITEPSKNGSWKQQFYGVDKNRHQKVIIDEFDEREKRQTAYEYSQFIYYNQKDTTRYFGDILRFNEMTFFKQAFQSMQYLNDTIYYFNHLKSCINLYSDSLILLDTIHVNYHVRDNWKQVILTDKIKNKAYTLFVAGTKFILSNIDLKTGITTVVTVIDKPFPSKIKVNNGFLYFLYIDTSNEYGKRELYRGEISN